MSIKVIMPYMTILHAGRDGLHIEKVKENFKADEANEESKSISDNGFCRVLFLWNIYLIHGYDSPLKKVYILAK